MKNNHKVKMSLCFLLGILLSSCHEFTSPTSHFGTGTYRCFYQDVRNGQLYKGVADGEKEATLSARNACINTSSPKDLDHVYCQFAECLFK